MTEQELMVGGAACAVYAIVKVAPYLSKKGGIEQRGASVDFVKMAEQVRILHVLHSKTDADGVPVWYLSTAFNKKLDEMHNSMKDLNKLLTQYIQDKK